jgi:hypothetical protein
VQLSSGEVERRTVVLGDSDDVMIVVNSGLDVGDRVVLNPRGAVQDARDVSLSPSGQDEDSTEEKSSDENQPSGIRQTEERDTVDVPRS